MSDATRERVADLVRGIIRNNITEFHERRSGKYRGYYIEQQLEKYYPELSEQNPLTMGEMLEIADEELCMHLQDNLRACA